MSKVAIVTDSNSGITQERGKELGIFVLPMPFNRAFCNFSHKNRARPPSFLGFSLALVWLS